MRVLLDANILISYLLTPDNQGVVVKVVGAAFQQQLTLLMPYTLLDELLDVTRRKKYLVERINAEDAEQLVGILLDVAELLPLITEPIPAVTRDPKDDYLLAYAFAGRADYLVTGDGDLLSLGELAGLNILSPEAFLTSVVKAPLL